MDSEDSSASFRVGTAGTLVLLVLVVVSSITGLASSTTGLGSEAVDAIVRGSDIVFLAVGVPLTALALGLARRGSVRFHLLWVAMLCFFVYGYSYYVFVPTFVDGFLLHVAIVAVGAATLAFALASLDPDRVVVRWKSRTPARVIAGFLILSMAYMVGNYGAETIAYLGGGDVPSDVLPAPEWRIHLGYALDMILLATPAFVVSSLLWLGHRWGHPLATVLLMFVAVYQLSFLGSAIAMDLSGIAGASDAIPQAIGSAILFSAVSALLLIAVGATPESGAQR